MTPRTRTLGVKPLAPTAAVKRIRELLESTELTQVEFAEHVLFVEHRTLARWLSGQGQIPAVKRRALASLELDVSRIDRKNGPQDVIIQTVRRVRREPI
jgi:hypothetical protein